MKQRDGSDKKKLRKRETWQWHVFDFNKNTRLI